MKLDILAVGVHPDDVELGCGGTLLKHISLGKKCGILDLTSGELGTRGSGPLRLQEAAKAAKILGVEVRENLGMADGFFENSKENIILIARILRKYQPEVVLANAIHDRHPDHGRAAKLLYDACFYSGLIKIETEMDGKKQGKWRPKAVYHYIQDRELNPDILVDITGFEEKKMEAVAAFASQFYNPKLKEKGLETPIATKNFIDLIQARMVNWGREAGFEKAEAFTVERTPGVKSLFDLV